MGEPGRRSRARSQIAPRVQRTSLASAWGGALVVEAQGAPAVVEGDVGLGQVRVEPVVGELLPAPGAGEEAALVGDRLRLDQVGPGDLGLGEAHARSATPLAAVEAGHGGPDPVDLLVVHAGPERQGQHPGGRAVGLGQGAVGRADPAVGALAVDRRGVVAAGLDALGGQGSATSVASMPGPRRRSGW